VDKKTATIMIFIQAGYFPIILVMNPLGIMIGWIVSSSGPLVVGIFTSISAGFFKKL
jgi:hypothetical protein